MPKIGVVTDSGADLYEPMAHMYAIREVPVVVRIGTAVFFDGDLTDAQFWKAVQHSEVYPTVSGPTALAFERAFADLLDRNDLILCLTASAELGGAYRSACTASERFSGHVTVLDTRSLSLAQAYQAIAAAEVIAAGQHLHEIIRTVQSIRDRTHLFIYLETPSYVRTGGRIDRILRRMEPILRTLKMGALLKTKDGSLAILGVAFSQAQGVRRIRREIVRRGPAEILTVAHTRRAEAAQDLAYRLVKALDFPPKDVLITEAGPVLSCLVGPGAIAASIVQRRS